MGEARDYWSECEQIFFHYGKGYGVTEDIKTISLGHEDDIKTFFETGEFGRGKGLLQQG